METLVCGKPILDVELLKTNTVYRVIIVNPRDVLRVILLCKIYGNALRNSQQRREVCT